MLSEIRDLNEIKFVECVRSKIFVIGEESIIWGDKIMIRKIKSFVTARIDFSTLNSSDIVFDELTSTVDISLPPVRLVYEGDSIATELLYHKEVFALFPIKARDVAEAELIASRQMFDEYSENSSLRRQIVAEAQRNASLWIRSLLSDYQTVNVHFAAPSVELPLLKPADQ